MSRSFKKVPCLSLSGTGTLRFLKHQANIQVRRFQGDLPSGGAYKKLFDFWRYFDGYQEIWYTPQAYRRYVEELWEEFEKQEPWQLKYRPNEKAVQAWAGRPRRK